MAYRSNPFRGRMSERTSDQEFVHLFSPKVIERLPEDVFEGAVHIFRSPPGGGKTTLLRAFTPSALKAFWNSRRVVDMNEAYQKLLSREIVDELAGPQLIGVLLSCASGYADLPQGATINEEGLFRALLDARIVLRTIRCVEALANTEQDRGGEILLQYDDLAQDLKSIPTNVTLRELGRWAEGLERTVCAVLDSFENFPLRQIPHHVRFEAVLWLQSVRFEVNGKALAPRRLLMIDDLHKLRRKQREWLIEELTDLRPAIPLWLAERSIAMGQELLVQGARNDRDLREHRLDEFWGGQQRSQFSSFAQNILQRRLAVQDRLPPGAFSQYLRDQIDSGEVQDRLKEGRERFQNYLNDMRDSPRYASWIGAAGEYLEVREVSALHELIVIRALIARDEARRQMSLELTPLPVEELDGRDSGALQAAAEVIAHEEFKIPYYFGIERICTLATNNVEELLAIAASLYDGLLAKQVLRKPELLLYASEQERLVREVAGRKRDFIPKSHTEGTRAQRLLDAVGLYCRERTFLVNAPYAPGVTGVRLSQTELSLARSVHRSERDVRSVLMKVLAECVAENLLVTRDSSASTSREGGCVFYLNRMLCAHFNLPVQFGGWQDVTVGTMVEWMEAGPRPSRDRELKIA